MKRWLNAARPLVIWLGAVHQRWRSTAIARFITQILALTLLGWERARQGLPRWLRDKGAVLQTMLSALSARSCMRVQQAYTQALQLSEHGLKAAQCLTVQVRGVARRWIARVWWVAGLLAAHGWRATRHLAIGAAIGGRSATRRLAHGAEWASQRAAQHATRDVTIWWHHHFTRARDRARIEDPQDLPRRRRARVAHVLRVALRGALRLCALLVVVAAAWLGYHALTTSRASLSQLSAFSPGQVAAPKAAASTPALVIHAPTPTASPAGPAAPAPYVVGAWVSNMSPPASGAVSLYVRVSNMQTDSPEARIPVSAEVQFTCADPQVTTQVGPIVTDGDGIARLSVPYSNLPVGIPVCITAVATIDGQVYTANTTFAAR